MGAGAARAHGRARARAAGAAEPRTQRPGLCGRRARLPVLRRADDLEPDAVERADGRRHAAARRRRRPPRRLRLRMPLRSVRRHGRRCRCRRRRRLCRRRRRADPPRARAQYECERALRLLRDARGGGGRCAAHRGVAQRARRVELHGGVHLLPAAPSRRALAEFGPRRRRHRRRARRSQLQRARVAARLPLRRLGGAARLRLAERAPARVRPRWPARRARRRARRRRRRGARPRAERGGRHCRQRDARALHVAAAVEWRVRRGRRLRRRGGRPVRGHDAARATRDRRARALTQRPRLHRSGRQLHILRGGALNLADLAALGHGGRRSCRHSARCRPRRRLPLPLPLRAGASAGGERGAARRPPRRVPHAAALPRGRLDARRRRRLPAWRRRWRRRRVPGGAATLDHAQRPAVHDERPRQLCRLGSAAAAARRSPGHRARARRHRRRRLGSPSRARHAVPLRLWRDALRGMRRRRRVRRRVCDGGQRVLRRAVGRRALHVAAARAGRVQPEHRAQRPGPHRSAPLCLLPRAAAARRLARLRPRVRRPVCALPRRRRRRAQQRWTVRVRRRRDARHACHRERRVPQRDGAGRAPLRLQRHAGARVVGGVGGRRHLRPLPRAGLARAGRRRPPPLTQRARPHARRRLVPLPRRRHAVLRDARARPRRRKHDHLPLGRRPRRRHALPLPDRPRPRRAGERGRRRRPLRDAARPLVLGAVARRASRSASRLAQRSAVGAADERAPR